MEPVQFINTDVKDVLAFYERLTGRRMLYSNQLTGNVYIFVKDPVPVSEAVKIIELSLAMHNIFIEPTEDDRIMRVTGIGQSPKSVLIPFIVPTVLSAIAFWWIYDTQFSIISWTLKQVGLISTNIDFLGDPWNARWSVIFANIWRGVPFVAITLLAGLQTVSPSLYEAATLDGATRWQMFRHITYPLLTPIIAVVMTFSVLFTFTDFQLIYVLTRGGPLNSTHLMATLSFQRAISGGSLGEGAAIATAMVPFLLAAILFSYFGLQRRAWQQGGKD